MDQQFSQCCFYGFDCYKHIDDLDCENDWYEEVEDDYDEENEITIDNECYIFHRE